MKLFDKTPSSRDLRLQLKDIERTQRQKQRRLQVLVQTKEQWIREAVAAKQAGKQELVLDIFRKLRQLEIDRGYLTADLRRLALARSAAVALRAKLESLERSRDRKGLKDLVRRLKISALQKAIDTAAVDDDTFGDMLREILAEEEMAAVETRKEDAGFAEFDRAIGEMAEADQYAAGIEWEPAQDLRLAGVSGRLRREPVIGAGTAAVSGSVRSLGISGAGVAAVACGSRRLAISGAGLAAVSGAARRWTVWGAGLAAASGRVRGLGVSGVRTTAVSGSVRRPGISGVVLASISGSARRRPWPQAATSGGIAAQGISGCVFASGAAYGRRGAGRLGSWGMAVRHDESEAEYASGPTGAVPDRKEAMAVLEEARPMPRLFLDGRCGAAGRVVIIEGYGKASLRRGEPDDRLSPAKPADMTLVRLDDAAIYVKGKPVPIRGSGIRVRKGELSFLVEDRDAGWFVSEVNSLMDAATSGAGPAVGELMWRDNRGAYTNVRRNNNADWQTLTVEYSPDALPIFAGGDAAAGSPPGGEPQFCRIILRPLAVGDRLSVHIIDGGQN